MSRACGEGNLPEELPEADPGREQVVGGTRILAVDYGRRRIGLAISDPLGITTHPLRPLEAPALTAKIQGIAGLCRKRGVGRIVVGLPRNMDGSVGRMGEEALAFGRSLEEATGLPVETWDERLTSREAERALRSRGLSPRKRKARVDTVAAQILLQAYLDARR